MVEGRTISRGGIFAFVAALSLGASQLTASADTLTAINLDCGDGYPVNATVDAPTLTKVQGALQGMIDSPAGLSCSLTTSPVTAPTVTAPTTTTTSSSTTSTTTSSSTAPSNSSPSSPSTTSGDGFATGGGRYVGGSGCPRNFGFSAHFDKNSSVPGAAHGTSNVTQPNSGPNCPQGHITSKVYCLALGTDPVTGNGIGQLQSTITQVDGFFATLGPTFAVGAPIETDITDNNSGPDMIIHLDSASGTCAAQNGKYQLTNGNIKIHFS